MESYYTDNEVYPAVAPATAAVGTGPTIGTTVVRVSKNTPISTTYNATAQAFCLVALQRPRPRARTPGSTSASQGGLQANTVTACPAAF